MVWIIKKGLILKCEIKNKNATNFVSLLCQIEAENKQVSTYSFGKVLHS